MATGMEIILVMIWQNLTYKIEMGLMGSASPTLLIRLFSVILLVAMLALITGTLFLSHPMGIS